MATPPASSTAPSEPVPKSPAAEQAEGAQDVASEPVKDQGKGLDDDEPSEGEVSETDSDTGKKASQDGEDTKDAPPLPNEQIPDGPPLPNESVPNAPPLPNEPTPQPEDDGWDCQWDPNSQRWYFLNRFTGKSQWDNPRVPSAPAAPGLDAQPSAPQPPSSDKPAAGGYNPAIHGDYDPNAWYAQGGSHEDEQGGPSSAAAIVDPTQPYGATASFNRFTGQFQTEDLGPGRHTDEAKSRRQMNAFFDVDAAANAHDGRSLKAERSGKKPSKTELKQFKEKRRARKEEKRRAWLRD